MPSSRPQLVLEGLSEAMGIKNALYITKVCKREQVIIFVEASSNTARTLSISGGKVLNASQQAKGWIMSKLLLKVQS